MENKFSYIPFLNYGKQITPYVLCRLKLLNTACFEPTNQKVPNAF